MNKVFIFIITKKENNKNNIDIGRLNNYWNGLGTCKKIISKNINYNKINYIQNVYQINFNNIKNQIKVDKSTGKEIFTLKIKYINNQKITINICVNNKTHFFLYDFEIYDKQLNKYEQFNLFKEAVNSKGLSSKDLLIDSMDNLIDKDDKFSLELFLELLDFYYKKKEGELLDSYIKDKWDYIYNCGKLNPKYNDILIKLEKNFELDQTNNKNMELLSNLLFIYKTKKDRAKIQEMILKKESYWHFYSKIIVRKLDFYSKLGVVFPKGLINIMLNQNNLSHDNILKLLGFGSSVSEILKMIIDNFNKLTKSCRQNNNIIKISDLKKKEYLDDLDELINNLKELIEKESECNYFFVSFDNNFWEYYINCYHEDVKKLKIIENIILIYRNKLYNQLDINKLTDLIHKYEVEIIKKRGLKNEKILNFFEENYIKENHNNSQINFPYYYYDEINLETADEQFFTKWKEMDMISYIDRNNFKKLISDKITKIENFGKIFKLFNNNKAGIAEVIENYLTIQPDQLKIRLKILLENDNFSVLMTKFRELMQTYNINICNNFIDDSCFLIYLIDLNNNGSVKFLDDVILKYINSNDIKVKIISKLLSNLYIANDLISFIIHYYFQNNNILNTDIEELIIKKLNNEQYKKYNHHIQVIEQIFGDLERLIINKEELFNEEENIEFFILLKKIQQLINNQKFKLSTYEDKFTSLKVKIINLKDKIINDLKNGNIKYNLIRSWLIDNEKKKLLIDRLNILSFGNTKEITDFIKSLEKDINQSNEVLKDAIKLKELLKEFFPMEQQKNIEYINNYENELKVKLLKDAKIKFNHINDLLFNEMNKLKSSKIFLNILYKKKGENINKDGISIFKYAQKEYIKLRELLDVNWEENIIEIIEEFPFKNLSENEIEEELFILKKYFEMNNINESEIINRKNRLIFIIKTRAEIINNLNNSFNFISEFSTQNIGNSLNNLKDIIIQNINLELINKYNNNNLIEKYFLNLSENIYVNKKVFHHGNSSGNINNNKNQQLMTELANEKEKNKKLSEQIQLLKLKMSNLSNRVINNNSEFKAMEPEEETFSIIFQTADQSVTRSFTCKKSYIFVDLEKKFYNENNKYKELETYLLCKGRKIFRFKTLEENKIKDSDIIIINPLEM